MRDERELNIDELSAVIGGATSMGGGGGFHPQPPFDFVKWLAGVLSKIA